MSFLFNFWPKGKYESVHVIIFFSVIFLSFFIFAIIKKVWKNFYLKQHYHLFPQLYIKNITNMAMIIAMNTAIIFVFIWLSGGMLGAVFQVYPGSRMFIENTLIKIGGILFGPVIGIFIGFTTDLLTVILTSSVLNYGYWFSACLNGFLGGIIHMFMNMKQSKKIKSTTASCCLMAFSLFVLNNLLEHNVGDKFANLNFLSFSISLDKNWIFIIFAIIGVFIMSQMILGVVANFLIEHDRFKNNKVVIFYHKSNVFLQIISINFCSYILIDVVSLPIFDVEIASMPYEQFLIMRIAFTIPTLLISSIIIWNIFKIYQKIKRIDIKKRKDEFFEQKNLKNDLDSKTTNVMH